MAAHYITLTPSIAPMAYVSFALEWITCIICIVFSIRFYLQRRGQWWMIAAIAFTAPLLMWVFGTAMLGVLPLPYGIVQVQKVQGRTVTTLQPYVNWDFVPPLMAIGMGVAAYENGRKRSTAPKATTPTARTEKTPEPSK